MIKGSSLVGKREIIRRVAKDTSMTQKQVRECLKSLENILVQLLRDNAIVILKGIGTFKLGVRKAKKAYIPGKGHKLLPDRHHVVIRPLIKL